MRHATCCCVPHGRFAISRRCGALELKWLIKSLKLFRFHEGIMIGERSDSLAEAQCTWTLKRSNLCEMRREVKGSTA